MSSRVAQLASQGKINFPSESKEIKNLSEFFSHAADKSLLNLLKQPFAIDSLRMVVLGAFELKYQRPFKNDLWEFIDWSTKNKRISKSEYP